MGEPIGSGRFDPVAAWYGDLLAHVHRVPRPGAAHLRTARACVPTAGTAGVVRLPELVVETESDALAVVVVPDALPLAATAGPRPWFTTATAQALLGDLARAILLLHSHGVTAGWVGPDSVLVDAFGRGSLNGALSIGLRRTHASPVDDVVSLATLAGWLAQRDDLRLSADVADLLDAALLDRPESRLIGPSESVDWLRRMELTTRTDANPNRRGHILDLRNQTDRRLLDAVAERLRETVLAAPDRPSRSRRLGVTLSRGRRGQPRRWSGW